MIILDNIRIEFQNKVLLDGFSLNLKKGEKAALKGRSGSGKTTILNIIMGFVFPTNGSVLINGTVLDHTTIRNIRKQITWLPQNMNLLGNGRVEDVLMKPFTFADNKKNTPTKEILISELSKLALEGDILDKGMESISGGEKQRLGIIICKLLRKDIILMDEPTSALDKNSLNRVADYILRDNALTVLSTSHDDDWLGFCDKVIELQVENGNS
jgi:ABC-type multidrug transport system ATPase subunit